MVLKADTVDEYLERVPLPFSQFFRELRQVIVQNIPEGFQERMSYGMIGYVVPHSLYPDGYHCNPKLPLPFVNLGVQKNYIGFYHGGVYAFPEIREWFVENYSMYTPSRLDMGKACIRFKKTYTIPYELIGELMQKISVAEWIEQYTLTRKK